MATHSGGGDHGRIARAVQQHLPTHARTGRAAERKEWAKHDLIMGDISKKEKKWLRNHTTPEEARDLGEARWEHARANNLRGAGAPGGGLGTPSPGELDW